MLACLLLVLLVRLLGYWPSLYQRVLICLWLHSIDEQPVRHQCGIERGTRKRPADDLQTHKATKIGRFETLAVDAHMSLVGSDAAAAAGVKARLVVRQERITRQTHTRTYSLVR